MRVYFVRCTLGLVLIFGVFFRFACAGIMAAGTRVIYTGGDHERSLMLANTNDYPVIVQTWVDEGSGNPDYDSASFIVLPPVFRLEPGEIKGIRLLYNQNVLPEDRESVAWLNLYEIPPSLSSEEIPNRLTLTMNTQLKIFYRPRSLPKAEKNPVKLSFIHLSEEHGQYIEACNPTPYHVSFTTLAWENGSEIIPVEQQMDMMVSPFSKKRYRLLHVATPAGKQSVLYEFINDNGSVIKESQPLDTGTPVPECR